jgi:hypothetical protein
MNFFLSENGNVKVEDNHALAIMGTKLHALAKHRKPRNINKLRAP